MKIYDEFNSPRLTLAKSKADEVWQRLAKKKIPILLNDIVKALGIPCKEDDLKLDGVSSNKGGQFCILYKRGVVMVRQRFTVAHELGHILLEHIPVDTDSSGSHSVERLEKEANAFANALLIPPKDLRQFTKNKDKSLQDIIDRYNVSRPAASIAIQNCRLLNRLTDEVSLVS